MQRQSFVVSKNQLTLTQGERKQLATSDCTTLDLSRSVFCRATIEETISALQENINIKELILYHCNFVSVQALVIFTHMITNVTHVKCLEVGDISVNSAECDLSPLIIYNKTLTELSIQYQPNLSCSRIFNALAFDSSLMSFKLENCQLCDVQQAEQFALMIAYNKTLTSLALPRFKITPCIQAGATLTPDLKTEIAINIAHAMTSEFSKNSTLKRIDLREFSGPAQEKATNDQFLSFMLDNIEQSKIREICLSKCSDRLIEHAHARSFPKENLITFLQGITKREIIEEDKNSNLYKFFSSDPLYDKNLTKLILSFAEVPKKSI